MKVIFLDIDGVLNSASWNDAYQNEINGEKLVDESRVQLLASLVKATDAKIVLHSGWRFWFDELLIPIQEETKYLVNILEHNKLKIYDKTPDLTTDEIRRTRKYSLVKANEILMWIGKHKNIETYVVLDDLDLKNDILHSNLILVDSNVGLSEKNVLDAIRLLNQ